MSCGVLIAMLRRIYWVSGDTKDKEPKWVKRPCPCGKADNESERSYRDLRKTHPLQSSPDGIE